MDSDQRARRDRLLRSAVLGGDEQAWQTWYDETFDELYGYVRWRCGGQPHRADEIVQETWLVAVRRLRRFDRHRGSFLAWLRGIAANVVRNELRRHNAAGRRRRPLDGQPAGNPTPEASLAERERAEQITAALDALPDRYEAVLRAKYLDSLSVAEIAAQRDETPKAVESLLTRARDAFREKYEKPT